MNMTRTFQQTGVRAQRGFALFAALLFLIVLTVLAVTVLRSSSLSERMTGNDLDRMRAYQAAEATIRDAQRDILQISSTGTLCVGLPNCRDSIRFVSKDNGFTDLTPGCNAGLCFFTIDQYATPGFVGPWVPGNPNYNFFAEYGSFSSPQGSQLNTQFGDGVAAPPLELNRSPRYWIEIIQGINNRITYRITVEARGLNPNTVVTLQEYYEPGV
jgi:type IV pilus assembly protein PilX